MEPGTSDRECGGTSEAKYKTVLANFAENIIGLVLFWREDRFVQSIHILDL